MPAKPDTSLNLIHADRMTTRNIPGGQLLIIEGNVIANIAGHEIKADRLEYDTEAVKVVATGNVVVTTEEEVIHGERYEWRKKGQ
jgi:lipopolysaccharide assembly outer membrane protein LptD (OstA)